MGLSKKNPTRHIDILRTQSANIQGFISPPKGHAMLPNYCEACKKIIYFPGTRQRFCKVCIIAYKLGLNRNPKFYENKKRKRLNSPELDEYIKKRNTVAAIRRTERLNLKINKKCICGSAIHFESKFCRSCAAKERCKKYIPKLCTVSECKNRHLAKGLCNKHYRSKKR